MSDFILFNILVGVAVAFFFLGRTNGLNSITHTSRQFREDFGSEFSIQLLEMLKNKFIKQNEYSTPQIHHEIDLIIKRCEVLQR